MESPHSDRWTALKGQFIFPIASLLKKNWALRFSSSHHKHKSVLFIYADSLFIVLYCYVMTQCQYTMPVLVS